MFQCAAGCGKGAEGRAGAFPSRFPQDPLHRQLVQPLDDAGHPVPSVLARAKDLTDYALEDRYPFSDREDEVTEIDYQDAVEIAEMVVRWAETLVRSKR